MDLCDNAFIGRLVMLRQQHAVIAVLNCLMMPCTLIANILLIYSLFKTRQLGSVVNNLFLCLCISDCCIAIIVQSLIAVLFTVYKNQHFCALEMAAQFLTFLFGHFSGFLIVTIAIDRYIHMKYLQRYEVIMTKTRAIAATVFCGVLAVIMGITYTLSTIYDVYQWVNMAILLVDMVAIIMIYAAYIEAYNRVREHLKRTKNLRCRSPNNLVSYTSEKKAAASSFAVSKKAAAPSYAVSMIITIMMILGAVFICYVPYVAVGIMGFYRTQIKREKFSPFLAFGIYLTYLLVYLNSFLNAVIFIYKNDAVRKFIKERFVGKPNKYDITPSTSSMQLSTVGRVKEFPSNYSIASTSKETSPVHSRSTLKLL